MIACLYFCSDVWCNGGILVFSVGMKSFVSVYYSFRKRPVPMYQISVYKTTRLIICSFTLVTLDRKFIVQGLLQKRINKQINTTL